MSAWQWFIDRRFVWMVAAAGLGALAAIAYHAPRAHHLPPIHAKELTELFAVCVCQCGGEEP